MRISKKKKILLIGIGILLIFVLNFFQKEVKNTFYLIFSPVEKIFWRAGESASDFFGALLKTQKKKKENKELLRQNLILLKEVVDLRATREENESLRKALNLGLEKKFKFVLTETFSKVLNSDFVLISGGEKEGIFKGRIVINPQGVLVGEVQESFPDFAKVRLISSQQSVFDIEIQPIQENSNELSNNFQPQGAVLGLAKGKGNLRIGFELVPKENELKKGEVVLTAALGGKFPKGLLVGEIKDVQKSEAEPFQRGEIKPYFTKTSLTTLFVITNFNGYDENK